MTKRLSHLKHLTKVAVIVCIVLSLSMAKVYGTKLHELNERDKEIASLNTEVSNLTEQLNTSKEALKEIDDILYINAVRSQVQDKILSMLEIIKQELDRLEKLEKENELLKLDNQDLHNQIKKNVKEHYKEFMEDYDCLLEEYHELYKVWEKLKKVIEILKDYFEIWLNYEEEEIFGGFEINGYHQINKQEYELLKEVLGNVG